MNAPWRVLDSDIAFPSRWATIRRDRVELPDGSQTDYFLAVRPHVALVLAFTTDDQAILVTQYKHGAGSRTTELPGGGFTPEEDPAEAAARELVEETGYVCRDGLHAVGAFYDDSSKNTNMVHAFTGTGAVERSTPTLDSMEQAAGLKTILVPRASLPAMLADGTIRSMSSVAAIYRALAD
ncbi:NUDIX hydrolase [Cryptosporangium sp. NPDC051539]|uniref:NUDIX hydrolase n=1 Tax=Cryptosporangium sp. NPDC051539 TaxID=3363962 RepID=UPI00379B833E